MGTTSALLRPAALRRLLAGSAAALALAGCQSVTGPAAPRETDRSVLSGMADRMAACWFSASDPRLAGYIYSPETNAGRSRILVLAKSNPQALPALVVEPDGRGGVTAYGPLANGPEGPRLTADVRRWSGGATDCS